ncbi:hypothetical protein TSOC_002702 [Tetrabaena socialis]|uniref:F-box domain-containing protein n=1 Tax=Tetrabaena socialis TaxID=47790 RepID=A0A2J8ADJ4_9CHLO|nr:hypothetical protein TSOC_002702 [Tetrabaena socialis]|eukprot:PNH10591.1 hypothetical protein TSOC_002702 [Tetrabaena socialis]
MKTFSRGKDARAKGRTSTPPKMHGPPARRGAAAWCSLPDGVLLQVAHGLPHDERARCRLVCKGWSAVAAGVERALLSVSPRPREAARQVAAAHGLFGNSCTSLMLQFPNFLLPRSLPAQRRQPQHLQPDPTPQRHHPTQQHTQQQQAAQQHPTQPHPTQQQQQQQQQPHAHYAAPLLPRGTFAAVSHLTLLLGVAGLRALPLDAFFQLPRLRALVLRGLAPAAAPPEGSHAAAGLPPPPPGSASGSITGSGSGSGAAAAAAGSGFGSGSEGRLGLMGLPGLEELTLSGLLTHKVLLEVAQVTQLRRLALEGRAQIERSDFVYVAALRR